LAETAPEERIAAPTQVLWPGHDPCSRAWPIGFSPLEAPEAWAGAIRAHL